MTAAQIITVFFATIALAFGVWIGSKIVRPSAKARQTPRSVGRNVMIAVGIGVLTTVGVWIGSRGDLTDPVMIYVGVAMWLIATFFALRRPKGA